jgi:hypothetical protein
MKAELKKIKSRPKLENVLEQKCVLFANQFGWIGHKMDGSGDTHYPDRLFVNPILGACYVEFKGAKGRLSPGQKLRMVSLAERGFVVALCNDFDAFRDGLTSIGSDEIKLEVLDWTKK